MTGNLVNLRVGTTRLLAIAVLALALLGCASEESPSIDRAESTATQPATTPETVTASTVIATTTTTATPPVPPDSAITVRQGFSTKSEFGFAFTYAGALVTNTSSTHTASVSATANFKVAGGAIVATTQLGLFRNSVTVRPNETVPVSIHYSEMDRSPDVLEVTVTEVSWSPGDEEPTGAPLIVSHAQSGDFGTRVSLSNPHPHPVNQVEGACVFLSGSDGILGGAELFIVDPVPADQTTEVELLYAGDVSRPVCSVRGYE